MGTSPLKSKDWYPYPGGAGTQTRAELVTSCVSQLLAGNSSIDRVPVIVTHGAPLVVIAHLHAPLTPTKERRVVHRVNETRLSIGTAGASLFFWRTR